MSIKHTTTGLLALLVASATLVAVAASAANAQTIVHTFSDVVCVANVNGTLLTQTQDVTVAIVGPDSVNPGDTFTLTFPGGSAALPTRSNGIGITSYSNLFQVVQINGTNFNPGSIVAPPIAGLVQSASSATLFSAGTTYALGVYVFKNLAAASADPADWHFYRSLAAGNISHPPDTSPTFWSEVTQVDSSQWSPTISYAANAFTIRNGVIYKSLVGGNLNHDPALSSAQWSLAPTTTPESTSLPLTNQIQYGQPGPFAPGNPGDPLTATLTTPDVSVQATAPQSGDVTINMTSLTTQVVLNNVLTAAVTCSVPNDTLMTIPVGQGNAPPTVDAGSDRSGDVNSPIAVSGSVTDPDSSPTTAWTIDSPNCNFADPNALSTTVTCTHTGVFAATLTADDGVNAPVSDTAQISVTSPNVAPTVDAGPNVSGPVGDDIQLNGSVTDPDSTTALMWTVDNSTDCSFDDATIEDPVINCTAPGTFVATLTADDGINAPVSDTAQVEVGPIPPGLNVTAGPDVSGATNAAITLLATVTDPGFTPTVQWSVDSPACSFSSPATVATTITCTTGGVFAATITGHDGTHPDASDTALVQVVAPNNAPVVDAGPDVTGLKNTPIPLHGTVTDPDTPSPAIHWSSDTPGCSFANAAAADTTISCSGTGVVAATLTADDGVNQPVSDVALVTVVGNLPPTVSAGPDASGDINTAIVLDGTVTDPDSTPSLVWTTGDPDCTFANPAAVDTTISCTSGGNVAATLTASDGLNAPVSDTAIVTVIAPNTPPTVFAGPDTTGTVKHALTLNGVVFDPDSSPVLHWATGSPSCSFGSPNAAVTTLVCTTTGVFAATLTADDGVNPPVSDTALVTFVPGQCTDPCVQIGDAMSYEGGVVAIPITLSSPQATAVTFTATIQTFAGGAQNGGVDFKTAVTHNMKIAAGARQAYVSVTAIKDALTEPDESFNVVLSNPAGAPGISLGRSVGAGTIKDATGAPAGEILIGSTTIVEINACGTCKATAKVSVVLSAPSPTTVTAKWSTQNAGATAGSDYTAKSNAALSFAVGGTLHKFLSVITLGDNTVEPTEGINVVLSNPSAGISFVGNPGSITILDND